MAVDGRCAKCDPVTEGKSQDMGCVHANSGGVNSDGAQTLGKP